MMAASGRNNCTYLTVLETVNTHRATIIESCSVDNCTRLQVFDISVVDTTHAKLNYYGLICSFCTVCHYASIRHHGMEQKSDRVFVYSEKFSEKSSFFTLSVGSSFDITETY